MRPKSIVQFERCYLAALLTSIVAAAISYRGAVAAMDAGFAGTPIGPGLGAQIFLATAAVGIVVPLLLWHFAARRASPVAKWIIVALFALSVLGMGMALARGNLSPGLPGLLSGLGFVLRAAAVWLLFRPDANTWFAGKPAAAGEAAAE